MTVHTHGPEEGPGLACPERLVGACVWAALDFARRDTVRDAATIERVGCAIEEAIYAWAGRETHGPLRDFLARAALAALGGPTGGKETP